MKPSIDLTDYKFLSDDHTRIQNGQKSNANNKGAWRGIWIKTSDQSTFFVTIYNMNGNHPIWGDNIQMAEKRMKLVEEDDNKIILRGFGTDATGVSFADYGLTLHKLNQNIVKLTMHMHDRNIDIVYEKAENKIHSESLNKISDFDNFKDFTHKWNTSMSLQDKMQIALHADSLTNVGVGLYNDGNLPEAIDYFERALIIMPNNDDCLHNLRLCYSEIGNHSKVKEMEKKLNYLS